MIRFTKMHGLGNDYVFVNCFDEPLEGVDLPSLSRAVSDRHRGIGSDGLILIRPPEEAHPGADARMEMYNADGSRGEMCGNGIRCVAKLLIEHEVIGRSGGEVQEVKVRTDRGVLHVKAMLKGRVVDRVRVDMGAPIFEPGRIPVALPGERCVQAEVCIGNETYQITCVSMGNPHAVMFVDSVDSIDLTQLGPLAEHHPIFPNRVNLHVASVVSRADVSMRTWERGSGLTQACGTGACAVLVAGVLEDRLDRSATVHLPGGDMEVDWAEPRDGVMGTVCMTGPAVEVYSGEWPT